MKQSDLEVLIKSSISNPSRLKEIVKNSYSNCHAIGLTSIVLVGKPDKIVRLFHTKQSFDVAFHPHHCDLTITVLKGILCNQNIVEIETGVGNLHLKKFKYRSAITDDGISFELLNDKVECDSINLGFYHKGEAFFLKSHEIHTVHVRDGEETMWLVEEGAEDPGYQPISYSAKDLNNQDFSDLYKKPREQDVLEILERLI